MKTKELTFAVCMRTGAVCMWTGATCMRTGAVCMWTGATCMRTDAVCMRSWRGLHAYQFFFGFREFCLDECRN